MQATTIGTVVAVCIVMQALNWLSAKQTQDISFADALLRIEQNKQHRERMAEIMMLDGEWVRADEYKEAATGNKWVGGVLYRGTVYIRKPNTR